MRCAGEEVLRRDPRHPRAAAGGILVNEDGGAEGPAQQIRLENLFRASLAEDQNLRRFRPILPGQPFDSRELRNICGHQGELPL